MRIAGIVAGFVVSLAAVTPSWAQSLEVSSGTPVTVEIVHVEASIDEGVARVEVDETFRNTTDRAQEGVYRFKLPDDAVIGSFSMWMEGREKTGRVLESRQARRIYDSIVHTRKDPGLLEQVGWREFRVNVFPIPAHDTVRVRLSYAHVVRDDLGLETLEVPLPERCGAIGDLRVHVTVNAAAGLSGVDCPSHASAALKSDANGAEANWSGDGVVPTGPFVLRAIPRRRGFDVTVLAHRPAGSADGWFVARVVPRLAAPPSIPRDVVFVFDRSGSMEGRKMDQARAALLRGLDTLNAGDRFDVISFSSDVTSLGAGHLVEADALHLALARRAAQDLTATGGTNIADALSAALSLRTDDANRLFAVVFLTDGDPTVGERNPDNILNAWRARSGNARLFAFGVGNDVHDFLLTKLAMEGRGDARYVREDENLEVKLGALFDRVRTPLLLDPSIDVTSDVGADGTAAVRVLDREPRRLPDLFQARALVVTGRYQGAGRAVLHLRGRSGSEEVKLDVPIDFPATTPERPHVAQIWAKNRIERLLDDMRATGADAEIRKEILHLGLTRQLVTPYTSFLVVEDGVRIPDAGETSRVPPEVIDSGAIPGSGTAQNGPVNPDDVIVPDAAPGVDADDVADTGEGFGDSGLPSGATGGTSIGVGKIGHFGTGKPSGFLGRHPGAGGRGGGGLGQGGGGGSGGSTKATEQAVLWALRWLKNHQSPDDGRWDADGFEAQCKLNRCNGAGVVTGDVGATAASLLVFLGAGETHQSGTCRETVKGALKYLRDVQDSDGCFGPRTAPDFLRQHAMAALAMAEAYGMTGSRVFKEPAQRGIAFVLASKTPLLAWNLPAPNDGTLDVETTGWMVMALKSAIMSDLDVDRSAIRDAAAAFEKVTDPAIGGVLSPGSRVSLETATAIGLLVRIFAGHTPATDVTLMPAADLLVTKLPCWDVSAGTTDFVYGHFATLAMFQVGGDHWKKWNDAMKVAVIDHERMDADRDERGSWDPVGPTAARGRIEATALNALCMEVYYRYGRVFGVRDVQKAAPAPTPPAGK